MLRRIPRPSAEICLRCSIRLFHRDTRSLSTSIARNVTDYKREASDYTLQDGDAGSTLDTPKGPFGSSRRLSLKSKNKRRRAGNRLLTEDTAPLDIDMLGKPARAIVLRDGGLYVKKSTIEKVEAEPAPASPDWAALLESQQLDPSAADVFANIESYKPVQERQLSERAFRKLQQTLFNGFKTSQLQGYLQWHASQPPDENSPESMALRLPWVHAITPWVQLAHTSSAASKVDSHLRGYISPSSSPKEKLTIRVLREAWRLSINELATGLGEVTVRLRNTEFTLLMRGTQRFVNLVGKTWLEPGEKIEALNGPKSVRFVIKKPKTDFLLAELDKTLNCIETKTLPLSLVTTEPLGDALIEELGRITNTHIAKSSNGRRIHITWIEVRSPDGKSPLEDLRHVVFRLLLTALAPTRTVTSLSSDHPAKATGRFVRDRTNTSKWAWKERMGEWERFVIPVPSSELTVEAETPAVPLQAPSLSSGPVPKATKNQGGQMFSTDDMTPDRYSDGPSLFPVRWAATVQTSTAAHFGHLLHAAEAYDSTETKAVTVADLTTAGRQRIFSPLIPHPTRLAELELRRSGTSQGSSDLYPAESTILIRFQPSPRTNSSTDEYITADARAGQSKLERRLDKSAYRKEATAKGHEVWPIAPPPAAPTLELRLTIQGTEVLGIQSLRAIKHKELTDVMLPSSLTDIRFTQAQYAELRGDVDAIAAWQPLADFLGHARFDLDRGKVDMPPRQKIPVPRGLFSDFDADESDPNELVGTQYEFVGLELHRAVSMPHRGYTMTYTSIEAGQGGGRRAELSLEAVAMPVPYKSAVSPASHELEPAAQQDASGMVSASETVATALSSGVANEDFVKACYDFARDESIWAGYPGDQRQ